MQKEMNDTVRQSARLRANFFDKLKKEEAQSASSFYNDDQQSFAPAGMASSTISRCSFSSPFSVWTAEMSIPQD